MVNGNQLTVLFHVDDLKASHMEQSVLDELVQDLNNKFQTKKKKLSETKGNIHDYLGLTISYQEKHQVIFTMYDFLEDILEDAPEDMNGTNARTPAKSNLFTVDPTSKLLNVKEADAFHRRTARLLFAAKRARPDIQVAVAYLCTRVKAPDQSDYAKLTRVIRYIRRTIHMPLVLGWDKSGTLL